MKYRIRSFTDFDGETRYRIDQKAMGLFWVETLFLPKSRERAVEIINNLKNPNTTVEEL